MLRKMLFRCVIPLWAAKSKTTDAKYVFVMFEIYFVVATFFVIVVEKLTLRAEKPLPVYTICCPLINWRSNNLICLANDIFGLLSLFLDFFCERIGVAFEKFVVSVHNNLSFKHLISHQGYTYFCKTLTDFPAILNATVNKLYIFLHRGR